MTEPAIPPTDAEQSRRVLEVLIRVLIVTMVVAGCFAILFPFVMPLLWGVVLAVAIQPLHARLTAAMRGHDRLAATVITVLALAVLLIPATLMAVSIVRNASILLEAAEAGSLAVPPPPDQVKEWPVVGAPVHETWMLAASNLEAALREYGPELGAFGLRLLSSAGNAAKQLLLFAFATIVAGILLAKRQASVDLGQAFARRLANERGTALLSLAAATIRSVAQGVLGVAAIQAVAAWLGFLLASIPAPGLWALAVLIVAIAQLPPLLVLLPIILYAFAHLGTVPAVIFTVWCVLVSASDAFLKPMLLGRGTDTPTLVILIGAIGGMLVSGIIGLFVGAVVLALGYELFRAWLHYGEEPAQPVAG